MSKYEDAQKHCVLIFEIVYTLVVCYMTIQIYLFISLIVEVQILKIEKVE